MNVHFFVCNDPRYRTADRWRRIKTSASRAARGSIFALGDCATIERPRSIGKAVDLFRSAAKCSVDGVCDSSLSKEETKACLQSGVSEFPHLEEVINNIDDDVREVRGQGHPVGARSKGSRRCSREVDNGLRALPATAQGCEARGRASLAAFFNAADGDAARARLGRLAV